MAASWPVAASRAVATAAPASCWGMVQRALHRHGLGRELALARLRQAEADPSIKRITLSTSQHTQGFYAGLGFQVTRIVSNGHGAGIDAVEMERRV